MCDDHQCPTLSDRLPRFDIAPSMEHGVENYQIASYLLLRDIDFLVSALDMLGLDDAVMLSIRAARNVIDEELMCEDLVHHEIFEQFLKDGMKFLPALQAAHRV